MGGYSTVLLYNDNAGDVEKQLDLWQKPFHRALWSTERARVNGQDDSQLHNNELK